MVTQLAEARDAASSGTTAPEIYFFGCTEGLGHRFVDGGLNNVSYPYDSPCTRDQLDTRLLPDNWPQTEGKAALVQMRGWTILTFWDRTVDARRNANSAFVARGPHTLAEMKVLAEAAFPTIYARFKFEITVD